MTVKIRLARAGAKKKPSYRIVVADSSSPRDGKFIEKVGYYDPMLQKDNPNRINLNNARISFWLEHGAQPTEKVITFIQAASIEIPEKIAKKHEIRVLNRKPRAPKAKKSQ